MAWAEETADGRDIVITKVDIDNLLRAKAAIYAGFSSLAQAVGVELEMVEELLIGGSFGQHINVEKAVEIGLLPDLSLDEARRRWQVRWPLGKVQVPGQHVAARRLLRPGQSPTAPRTAHDRRQDDLPGALGRQQLLRPVHVGDVFAAYEY